MTAFVRRWARPAFCVYALLLFIATHTPRVEIPGPGRPDLIVHAGALGLWASLLIACRFFGPALSFRNIAVSTILSAAYAGLDELLQGIPIVQRVAAWDDWGADLLGVGGAAAGAGVLRLVIGSGRSLEGAAREGP